MKYTIKWSCAFLWSMLWGVSIHGCEMNIKAGPLFNFARFKLGSLPRIQGYLAGLHTDFELITSRCFYTSITGDFRWNAGFVCGEQETKLQIKDYRPQWWVGYQWCTRESVAITPFSGFGFYYLSNEVKPDVIRYRYYNIFVPIGLSGTYEICPDDFMMKFAVWYRPDVWTRVKIETPCVKVCEGEKIKLKRSHGVHIEGAMIKVWPCNEGLDIQAQVVPFFDWNRFGSADQTNCGGLYFEIPRLDRWYLGIHIDVGIQF